MPHRDSNMLCGGWLGQVRLTIIFDKSLIRQIVNSGYKVIRRNKFLVKWCFNRFS